MTQSTLYIVATPIGNLEDITLRAIRILQEVDLVLCEDTRVTGKLLKKYNITTPRESYHSHSKDSKVQKIFELLKKGKNIALVSDAGTPTISDPGVMLIQQIKEHFGTEQGGQTKSILKEPGLTSRSPQGGRRSDLGGERFDLRSAPNGEVKIIPIPGPSAVITALSASGISSAEFTFLGFLPHKKGRETLFKEIAELKRTVVFYESPHRILKTLESLAVYLDVERPSKRRVVLARELTKIHEEFLSGTAEELKIILTEDPQKQKGEFVVIVEGK